MTEGIIQQVFTKYFIKKNFDYTISITDYNGQLSMLKEELIAEIKKEFDTKEYKSRLIDNRLVLKDLIGDNQQ